MASRFVPNPDFHREARATRPFRTGMAKITVGLSQSIKAAALPFRDTGNYIDRIHPRSRGRSNRVDVEYHFGHIIELGSVNNAPQHNIRRGVREAGLMFRDDRAAQ